MAGSASATTWSSLRWLSWRTPMRVSVRVSPIRWDSAAATLGSGIFRASANRGLRIPRSSPICSPARSSAGQVADRLRADLALDALELAIWLRREQLGDGGLTDEIDAADAGAVKGLCAYGYSWAEIGSRPRITRRATR